MAIIGAGEEDNGTRTIIIRLTRRYGGFFTRIPAETPSDASSEADPGRRAFSDFGLRPSDFEPRATIIPRKTPLNSA